MYVSLQYGTVRYNQALQTTQYCSSEIHLTPNRNLKAHVIPPEHLFWTTLTLLQSRKKDLLIHFHNFRLFSHTHIYFLLLPHGEILSSSFPLNESTVLLARIGTDVKKHLNHLELSRFTIFGYLLLNSRYGSE